MQVIDAREVNPEGAVLVSANEAALFNDLAIAQPCRGGVPILPCRGGVPILGMHHAAGGLEDHWKSRPSGNHTEFELTDARTGSRISWSITSLARRITPASSASCSGTIGSAPREFPCAFAARAARRT